MASWAVQGHGVRAAPLAGEDLDQDALRSRRPATTRATSSGVQFHRPGWGACDTRRPRPAPRRAIEQVRAHARAVTIARTRPPSTKRPVGRGRAGRRGRAAAAPDHPVGGLAGGQLFGHLRGGVVGLCAPPPFERAEDDGGPAVPASRAARGVGAAPGGSSALIACGRRGVGALGQFDPDGIAPRSR